MNKDYSEIFSELECKIQEVVSLMFGLCEKRMQTTELKPSPRSLALAASALTAEKAIAAYLAVLRISE